MHTLQSLFFLLILGLSGPFQSSCGAQALQRFAFGRGLMGTQFRVILFAPDSLIAQAAYSQVSARMDTLNQIMSDYLDGSEINRLSETSGLGRWVAVSAPLYAVLQKSYQLARLSNGRYDPTIGPLSQLWRRAVRQRTFPPSRDRRHAQLAVGYRLMQLDSTTRSVRLLKPNMRLDVGGIGQGFAVDEAAEVLRAAGIYSFLLDLGGDILAGSPPPDRPEGWRINVGSGTNTRPDPADTLVVLLRNAAITTSGDTYRHLDLNGKRYSHVMNPRSGLGLRHFVRVTVMAPEGYRADALTKVFSVAKPNARKRLIRRFPGVRVWVLEKRRIYTVNVFPGTATG
ncbi:MAG: FAD:protein FMN transferase [Cytophagales bacterium]|nr:MAG: FAD:protein FMN transferase [Cytophagales bacterium]